MSWLTRPCHAAAVTQYIYARYNQASCSSGPSRSTHLRFEVGQALRHHLACRQSPHPGHKHRAIALGVQGHRLRHHHIEQGFHFVLPVAFCLQDRSTAVAVGKTLLLSKGARGHNISVASCVLCCGPALLSFGTTGPYKTKAAHNRTAVATIAVVPVYCCTQLPATDTTSSTRVQHRKPKAQSYDALLWLAHYFAALGKRYPLPAKSYIFRRNLLI